MTSVETLDIDSCGGPFVVYLGFIVVGFFVLVFELISYEWRARSEVAISGRDNNTVDHKD